MTPTTRTTFALVAFGVVLVLVIACAVSTCSRSCSNVGREDRPQISQEKECDEEEDETPSYPEKPLDEDAPPGVTGEVVCVPLEMPTEIPCEEAVMINEDKDNLPQTQDGEDVALYLYDDPDDEELNLIVESQRIAVEVWWLEPNGEWRPSPSAFYLEEEGSTDENIEFLMPSDSAIWGNEVYISFSPVK